MLTALTRALIAVALSAPRRLAFSAAVLVPSTVITLADHATHFIR